MYRSRYRPSRRHILRPQDSGRGVVETTYSRRNKRDAVFQTPIGTLLKTINSLPPYGGNGYIHQHLSLSCESHVAQRRDRSPMTSHLRTSLSIHYLSFHLSHYTSPSFASFVVTHVLTSAPQISLSFSLKYLSHPLTSLYSDPGDTPHKGEMV